MKTYRPHSLTRHTINFFSLVLSCSLIVLSLASCGSGKKLKTEAVEPPAQPEDNYHDLFLRAPGNAVRLVNYAGAVDPVGTAIIDDFDGDGIINAKETTTNVWIADYPYIDTNVAPPVTMRIEIREFDSKTSKAFDSEIDSSSVDENIDKASEAVHRNEVNLRTVQFQDSFNRSTSSSSEKSMNMSASAEVKVWGSGGSASFSYGSKVAKSMSDAYGETTTKWKDVPYKNNLGRTTTSLKRTEAAKNSRALRREIRDEFQVKTEITPNAGYIRAALYITNESVNMPVKLRDILCSFMFETPRGELLPVQSFKLRNDDYSIFEIALYGGTVFGPYVIELNNLNTAEIKEAIELGYNPRIFIIDYEMVHVDDSNYRQAISSSFTGTNLKIIEENAKGRTAGVKYVGPGLREFYRVTAFDAKDASGNPIVETRSTKASDVEMVSPGVTLEKALRRIAFSGTQVEFADYVLDFTGVDPEIRIGKNNGDTNDYYEKPAFHVRGVRSIGGIETRIPYSQVFYTYDALGKVIDRTYIMKPIPSWTKEDFKNFKVWVVFDKGRYYRHDGDFGKNPLLADLIKAGMSGAEEYEYLDSEGKLQVVPKVQGVTGCIWPGDHYDIVYLDLTEVMGLGNEGIVKDFGINPLESGSTLSFNTRWNMNDLGKYPFKPDVHAQYLGDALLGDTVELRIKLDSTAYLNPRFGVAQNDGYTAIFSDFGYDYTLPIDDQLFSILQALDFEISFGVDGRYSDWMNLFPDRSPFKADYYDGYDATIGGTVYPPEERWKHLEMIDYSWNYLKQEFAVKLKIAEGVEGVGDDGEVGIYLRTALNNAYRESVWPYHYSQVKRFRGMIQTAYYDTAANTTLLTVTNPTGTVAIGDILQVQSDGLDLGTGPFPVSAVSYESAARTYRLTVQGNAQVDYKKRNTVFVNLTTPLTEPELRVAIDNDFYTRWNEDWNALWHTSWQQDWRRIEGVMPLVDAADVRDWMGYSPALRLGYMPSQAVVNWLGNDNVSNPWWNNWADASKFYGLLDDDLYYFLTTDSGSAIRFLTRQIGVRPDSSRVEFRGSDFLISAPTGTQAIASVAIAGDRALVLWQSYGSGFDSDIRGRLVQVSTGEVISDDIPVSTSNANNQCGPSASIAGDYAFVLWDSNDGDNGNIRGRQVNMVTGQGIGNDFVVNSTTANTQGRASIAASGNRLLAVWESLDDGSTYNIRGRFLNASTGEGIGNDFVISTTNANSQFSTAVSMWGDRAFALWESNDSGSYYTIRGRFLNASTGEGIGSDFVVNTTMGGVSNRYPSVSMANDRALAVWTQDLHDPATGYVRGRLFNAATGLGIGNDFPVNTITYSNNQSYPSVTVAGMNGLVVWASVDMTSMYDIRGRLMNVSTGEWIGDEFPMNTTTVSQQQSPAVASAGDQALTVWTSSDIGEGYYIRGRFARLLPREIYAPGFEHGLGNFFIAPLIERNYSVRASIVEEQQ